MKIFKSLGLLVFITLCLQLPAQKQMEIGAKICLQSPSFWNGSLLDVTSPKYSRIRPAFGLFVKYHLNKVFFVEYDADLSWEGGGYEKRRTELNFLKNTIFLGISTNTCRKNSINLKLGINHNFLLSGEMHDLFEDTKTDVVPYFRNTSICFPFSLGYIRRIGENTSIGLNSYFQFISGPLSTQDHIAYAQTLQRLEIKVARSIN